MGVIVLLGGGSLVGLGLTLVIFQRTQLFSVRQHLRRIFFRVNVEDQRELIHAVAVWTENLRDAISASSGIEQAIIASGHFPPPAIEEQVRRLVAALRYNTIDDALHKFAEGIATPTSDFVVASLLIAVRHQTRDFASLLTHLSECARAECDLYLRVWVSRARSRTAVRIINYSVAIFALGLVLLNPAYVVPFFTREGLLFLFLVVTCFVGGLLWLRQLTTLQLPQRFLDTSAVK